MQIKLGRNAFLGRNTGTWLAPIWEGVGNVTDLTLNLEEETDDVTTRDNNGWRAKVVTMSDGSVETEMIYDPDDLNFVAIRDAWKNKDSVELAVMTQDIATSGSEGLHSHFTVTSFSIDQGLSKAQRVKIKLEPTYHTTEKTEWMEVA